MTASGEFELIERIRERLRAAGAIVSERLVAGSGDDAAVGVPGGATATSVDAIVEDVHFRRRSHPPRDIGHRALAAALSDLAAMGAEPGEAYVVLALPVDLEDDYVLEIADGMAELAARTGTVVAGGDLVTAAQLALSVTVVGHAPSAGDLVLRSGARAGDLVVVTGELGGSAAGLCLLEGRAGPPVSIAPEAERLIERHRRPEPRLEAGYTLARLGATAMIDISDGLAADAAHVAAASGLSLVLELEALPVARGVAEVAFAAGVRVEELVVGPGDDHELLATLPPERLEDSVEALSNLGLALTAIGRVDAGGGVRVLGPDGAEVPASGYDHRRERGTPPVT